MRLTLRTLLAYLDDALEASEAREIGRKIAESESLQDLVTRIRQVTRRRRLTTPEMDGSPEVAVDPNLVSAYLDNELDADDMAQLEKLCLESDVNLAEVAACHQVLTLAASQLAKVPPTARERMYRLVEGPESAPRKAAREKPVLISGDAGHVDEDDPLLLGLPAYGPGQTWRQKLAYAVAAILLIGGLATLLYYLMQTTGRPDRPPIAGSPRSSPPAATPPVPVEPTRPVPPPVPPDFERLFANLHDAYRALAGVFPDEPSLPAGWAFVVLPGSTPNGYVLIPRHTFPDRPPPAPAPINEPDRTAEEVAVYLSKENTESLVLRQLEAKEYRRLRPARKEKVVGGEPLITLPAFRGEFEVPSEVRVETFGNFYRPEQPSQQVLESVIEFHKNPSLELDCTLHRGRALFHARPAGETHIRIRFRNRVVDVWMAKPQTSVAVELRARLFRGRDNWLPSTTFSLMAIGGDIEIRMAVRARDKSWHLEKNRRITAGGLYTWDSELDVAVVVPEPGNAMPWADKRDRLADDVKSAALAVEDRVRNQIEKGVGKESTELRDAFYRSLNAEKASPLERRLAIYGLAAIDHLKPILAAMEMERDRPDVRHTGLSTMWHWLARGPEGAGNLKIALREAGLDDSDADLYLLLLRGWASLDRGAAEAIVRGLGHKKSLAIRDAAHFNLGDVAPDVYHAIPYNSAADPDSIERATERIRQRLVKP